MYIHDDGKVLQADTTGRSDRHPKNKGPHNRQREGTCGQAI